MVIIRYNLNTEGFEDIYEKSKIIKEQLNDEEVLVIPQDWDILFNCTTADLYAIKEHIEHLIHEKELCEEF